MRSLVLQLLGVALIVAGAYYINIGLGVIVSGTLFIALGTAIEVIERNRYGSAERTAPAKR